MVWFLINWPLGSTLVSLSKTEACQFNLIQLGRFVRAFTELAELNEDVHRSWQCGDRSV